MMKKTFTKLFVAFLALLLAPSGVWAQDALTVNGTAVDVSADVADVLDDGKVSYTAFTVIGSNVTLTGNGSNGNGLDENANFDEESCTVNWGENSGDPIEITANTGNSGAQGYGLIINDVTITDENKSVYYFDSESNKITIPKEGSNIAKKIKYTGTSLLTIYVEAHNDGNPTVLLQDDDDVAPYITLDLSGDTKITGDGKLMFFSIKSDAKDVPAIKLGENTTLTIDGVPLTIKGNDSFHFMSNGSSSPLYESRSFKYGIEGTETSKIILTGDASLEVNGQLAAISCLKEAIDVSCLGEGRALLQNDLITWSTTDKTYKIDGQATNTLFIGEAPKATGIGKYFVTKLPIIDEDDTDNKDTSGDVEIVFTVTNENEGLTASVFNSGSFSTGSIITNVAYGKLWDYEANEDNYSNVLGTLEIPSYITNPDDKRVYKITNIGDYAFGNDPGNSYKTEAYFLKKAIIPETVHSLGEYAFGITGDADNLAGCVNLAEVEFKRTTKPESTRNSFEGVGGTNSSVADGATLILPVANTWGTLTSDWAGANWNNEGFSEPVNKYNIIVNENYVTENNASDVLGNGLVVYDNTNHKLSLADGTTLSRIENEDTENTLTIEIGGNATISNIKQDALKAIYGTKTIITSKSEVNGKLTFNNGAGICVEGVNDSWEVNAELSFTNVEVEISGYDGYGIKFSGTNLSFGENSIVDISNAKSQRKNQRKVSPLIWYGDDSNFPVEDPIHIIEGLTVSGGFMSFDTDWGIGTYFGNYFHIAPTTGEEPQQYGLFVNGGIVTEATELDIMGDSKVSFDATDNILTLNDGATLTSITDYNIDNFVIDVLGDVSMSIEDFEGIDIYNNNVTLRSSNGKGKLTIVSDDGYAIGSTAEMEPCSLNLENIVLDVKAYNIAMGNGDMTISIDDKSYITIESLGAGTAMLAANEETPVPATSTVIAYYLGEETECNWAYNSISGGSTFKNTNNKDITKIVISPTTSSSALTATIEDGSADDVTIDLKLTANNVVIQGIHGSETAIGSIVVPNAITVGNEVLTVTAIGDGAFEGQTNLTGATLPKTVTSIGENAFAGCTNMTSLTVQSPFAPTVGEGAFTGTSANLTVNYPAAAYAIYNEAGWTGVATFQPTVMQPNEWSTICSTQDYEVPEGLEAYIVVGIDYENCAVKVKKMDYILADTPMMLRKIGAAEDYPVHSLSMIIYQPDGEQLPKVIGDEDAFIGYAPVSANATPMELPESSGNNNMQAYILIGNSFVRWTSGTLAPYRCFLWATQAFNTGAAPQMGIEIVDGETTGVGDVRGKKDDVRGEWYDLSGRKLQGKPTQKGVYIINGKKVNVK